MRPPAKRRKNPVRSRWTWNVFSACFNEAACKEAEKLRMVGKEE